MSNEITTPYDRVLIDPNEPLILPDGTAITGRLETFLYALCCLDYDNLPTPLSRIEEFANALITGEIPNIEPQSRSEQFFLAILDGNIDNLPEPQSRSEVLLNKLAVGDFDLTNVDPIQSRYELLLAYLIKNGGVGNLDYVLYEFYQATQTLYNTQEKPVKSAILKGQTLVNLAPNGGERTLVGTAGGGRIFYYELPYVLAKNKKYILYYNVKSIATPSDTGTLNFSLYSDDGLTTQYIGATTSSGFGKIIFTTSDQEYDGQKLWAFVRNGETTTVTYDNIMLIEYQEGMENWDIPYFEGMQSVKMPVLTTTGKNLFELPQSDEMLEGVAGKYIKLNLKPNTNYTYNSILDKKGNASEFNFYGWISNDINSNFTGYPIFHWNLNKTFSKTFNTGNDEWYFHILSDKQIDDYRDYLINFQLEEGSIATSFESYKSNILMVNEEVELRGIGNVKDELNLLTGKLTQRVGEITLNGSENWIALGGVRYALEATMENIKKPNAGDVNILSADYPVSSYEDAYNGSKSISLFPNSNYDFWIRTNIELNNSTLFKQWLFNNPITIQYQLATESVKTVDLSVIDQDGNVLPKIKTFNNITHVNVSSDGILPKVEMEVATYNEEDIANANVMTASMDEIYSVQNELDNTNSIQSEEIDSTMIASTEIYENIL